LPSSLEAVASQAQVEHAAGDELPVDPAQHAKALGLEPQQPGLSSEPARGR
jgi:hypothetical protein